MWQRVTSVLLLLGAVGLMTGCGPMQKPMPSRLDAETQKQIDEAWNSALTPVARFDRQQWLDTFVLSYAFEAGVDRLSFHSEKQFSGGQVVMEIQFDRSKPGDDRFEVTVVDQAGKSLRHERYSRADVEQTYHFFYDQLPNDEANNQQRQARIKLVEQLFPVPKMQQGPVAAKP